MSYETHSHKIHYEIRKVSREIAATVDKRCTNLLLQLEGVSGMHSPAICRLKLQKSFPLVPTMGAPQGDS